MHLYPAIDIKSGVCVRLYQGCYDKVTTYSKDPVALALSFAEQGASFLHVVDLDGALTGKSVNLPIIESIMQHVGLTVQTGGGIRSAQQIQQFLQIGIERIIVGSLAVTQPLTVKNWLQEFGSEHIVLALDIRMDHDDPKLALHGWQTESSLSLWQLLAEYQDCGLKHVLCTDIHRDGTLQGPNIGLYQACVNRFPNLHFQASGGVSSLADLKALAEVPVAGVIIGKALYENAFSLRSALEEVSAC